MTCIREEETGFNAVRGRERENEREERGWRLISDWSVILHSTKPVDPTLLFILAKIS